MNLLLQKILLLTALLGLVSFRLPPAGPGDSLPAAFHKDRREQLRKKLPANSVAVLFAAPVRNRANDVDFVYHPGPDFYYLTGYTEPHAVLLLFASPQQNAKGETFTEMLFVQRKNPQAEQWTGKRMGVTGVKQRLGFDQVFENTAFESSAVNFKSFDKVLFLPFGNDVRDEANETADLFDLIRLFKQKTGYPENYHAERYSLYHLLQQTKPQDQGNAAQTVGNYVSYYPSLRDDTLLQEYMQAPDETARLKTIQKMPKSPLDGYTLPAVLDGLREIKTEAELKLLRKAIDISALAQREVMKAIQPGMSEREIQGMHEFVYRKYGSEFEGYPSIVGAGNNGCVLHYIENNKEQVGKDLVLMDIGAEYHGYTADVTRTVPASGKFSKEQRVIYDLVYRAQEAGIAACKVNAEFSSPHKAAAAVITQGLQELGIIKQDADTQTYFPHGTSHYLGLDVHDRGTYGPLKAGSVITVEPGIYIPEGSPCDQKWWGIAVRIEDDILITANGPENLSAKAPRKAEEIEKLMTEESAFNQLKLPKLE